MKLHIYDKPCDGIGLKLYIIKVNGLIRKRTICYIVADEASFTNFIHGGINNIRAKYNYIESSNKDYLYKYTIHYTS